MSDDEKTEAMFDVGHDIHTEEGIAGTITSRRWNDDEATWYYGVDWEDGKSDEQPEALFAESWDL